jgi:hypothetical protein
MKVLCTPMERVVYKVGAGCCKRVCKWTGAKYADIRAGAFLEQRLREIGLIKDLIRTEP